MNAKSKPRCAQCGQSPSGAAGKTAYAQSRASTAGLEKEIETNFVRDVDKTDLSDWLFNGTPETPGDLGYWVGYRIVRAYYRHAPDKQSAVREIIEMSERREFLAKSGWYPGIELEDQR